jgi:hypothetical protein
MIKEHDLVLVEGTIVHIYPGMKVCEVEFSNPETLPGSEAVVILPIHVLHKDKPVSDKNSFYLGWFAAYHECRPGCSLSSSMPDEAWEKFLIEQKDVEEYNKEYDSRTSSGTT